jgi:hypothetical protein
LIDILVQCRRWFFASAASVTKSLDRDKSKKRDVVCSVERWCTSSGGKLATEALCQSRWKSHLWCYPLLLDSKKPLAQTGKYAAKSDEDVVYSGQIARGGSPLLPPPRTLPDQAWSVFSRIIFVILLASGANLLKLVAQMDELNLLQMETLPELNGLFEGGHVDLQPTMPQI